MRELKVCSAVSALRVHARPHARPHERTNTRRAVRVESEREVDLVSEVNDREGGPGRGSACINKCSLGVPGVRRPAARVRRGAGESFFPRPMYVSDPTSSLSRCRPPTVRLLCRIFCPFRATSELPQPGSRRGPIEIPRSVGARVLDRKIV